MKTNPGPYRIDDTFLHLGPDGVSIPLRVTDTFWQDLGAGKYGHLGPGRLVSHSHCTEDWKIWEMHPKGEEVVCLLSGAVDFVLSHERTESTVALQGPGSFAIIPRGAWHTVTVHEPSSMLFITPGEGTEHRPR